MFCVLGKYINTLLFINPNLVALMTLVSYSLFTVGITSWRTKFRVQMNKLENEASAKV